MQEEYFKLNLYGDNWGALVQEGKYIFKNMNCKVSANSSLPFLVFHYVTDYNLDDLELFFRLAGFSAFTEEELPSSIVMPININLTNKKNVHSGWFGGFTNEEDAKIFIESELGENIISKFKDIKKKQLLQKRVILLNSLETINQELDNSTHIDLK